MADKVFYTWYRFFEEMHGPGDAAEVAALFTWCFLLLLNIATVAVLLMVLAGNVLFVHKYSPYAIAVGSIAVAVTQYLRYLTGDRLEILRQSFSSQSPSLRSRRLWFVIGYSVLSLSALIGSLWCLIVARD